MKQTSGALSFLLSAYRSVFSAAYAKGIAAAVVLTAGLAAGAAQAAPVDSWADAVNVEGGLTDANPLNITTNQASVSGTVTISSGTGHKIFADASADVAAVNVASASESDDPAVLNVAEGATFTLEVSGSSGGTISVDLDELTLAKGSTLTVTRGGTDTIKLAADEMNIGIALTTGTAANQLNEIGKAGAVINLTDGGSITNTVAPGVKANTITVGAGAAFVQSGGSFNMQVADTNGDTSVNSGDQTLTVEDGGVFVVGGSSAATLGTNDTIDILGDDGLQAINGNNTGLQLDANTTLKLNLVALKSYTTDEDYTKNIGSIDFSTDTDAAGKLTLSGGTLVVKDETVSSYTDDFEGVLGSSALTTGTVEFNAVTFDKAAAKSTAADVKAATLTLGTAGLGDVPFGVKSFTVTDTLNLIANADEDYRQVKDDLALTAEGDGVINGNLEFNASKTFSVTGGDWVADGNLKFTEGTFKVTADDADDSASLTANGSFTLASSKIFTVGGSSDAAGTSSLDLNGSVDIAGTLTAKASDNGTATIDLTDATLVNGTGDAAAIKGTIKAEASGTVVITADKLEAAIANDAKNKGYIFDITGGTLKVTGDSLTLNTSELKTTASTTSDLVLGAAGTLDASDAVVTLDAGSDASATAALTATSNVKAAGLTLAYTGAGTTYTLDGGKYSITGDVTGAAGKSIKVGGTAATVLDLDSATGTKNVTENVVFGNTASKINLDGTWNFKDVTLMNGSDAGSFNVDGDDEAIVTVKSLDATSADAGAVKVVDDLTVTGKLTATANSIAVDGGRLEAQGDLALAQNSVSGSDAAEVVINAAKAVKNDNGNISAVAGYTSGAFNLDSTSTIEAEGLQEILGAEASLKNVKSVKDLLLGSSSGSLDATGIRIAETATMIKDGDISYTNAKEFAGIAGQLNGARVTDVDDATAITGTHHWGSAQLKSGDANGTLDIGTGTVNLHDAYAYGDGNFFVATSDGKVAGVNFSSAAGAIGLYGDGEIGDITAGTANHGKVLTEGNVTAGNIGKSTAAIGEVNVQGGSLTASSLYASELNAYGSVRVMAEDPEDKTTAALTAASGELDSGSLYAQGLITLGTTGAYEITGIGSRVESETGLMVGANGIDVLGSSVIVAPYLDFASTSAVFYLDPAWDVGPAVSHFGQLTEATGANTLEGDVVVGQNSAFYLGDEMTESEFTAYADSHLSENGTTALAYIDKPLTVGATTGTGAQLIVDGSVTGKDADGTALTAHSTDAVYIGENSRLVLGNAAFGEDGTSAAITLDSHLSTNINFTNDGVIEIAPDKVSNGADFTLVQNGGSGTVELGTVESANKLFGLNDNNDGTVTYVYNKDGAADAALSQTDASIRNMINAYATNEDEPGEFDTARDDGVGFVSRAVNLANASEIGRSLDSAAQFVTAGGVPQVSLMAQKAGVSAIETRMGFNGAVASAIGEVQGTDATVWVTPLYSSFESDSFDMGAQEGGVDADLFGVAVGSDFMVADALRLGVAFNVGSGDSDSEGDLASTSNDFEFLGANLYGGYEYGALAIMADLGYTMVSSDIDQSNAAGALSADIDSTVFSVGVQGRYVFDVSGFDIAPHLGVRYTRVDVEDYTVSGVIDGDSIDQSLVTFPVGVTFSKDIAAGDWDVKPVLDLSVIPAAGDTDVDVDSTFINMGDVSVNSEIVDSVSFGGKLGIEAEYGSFGLGLSYQYLGSSNVDSHNVMGNVRYSF